MITRILYLHPTAKLFFIALLGFVCSQTVSAQAKQTALIIGINTYKPPLSEVTGTDTRRSWSNLDGCVNDATAMRDVAIAKYNFPEKNITTLLDAEASRDRIISELKKLVAEAKAGDVVFIYYAGHGSQVKNSLSKEADKKDETIVPADAWKKG
ncbi:MAG: caspase family protein, partial [Chitinophagaceae bacterium]